MTGALVQPASPAWRFWFLWMLGTLVGAVAGMILSAPFQLILEALMGGDSVPPPWTAAQTVLIMLFKGAEGGMMGFGMGLGQWWVFRKYLRQTGGWILVTGLALFAQSAFRWSLPYDTPPAQVGVITALSFGLILGLCQWFVLRGRLLHAARWIAINVAGWAAAIAVGAVSELAQLSVESFLGMVFIAISTLVPFAAAGGGMVWLLRQTALAGQASAPLHAKFRGGQF